MATPASTPETGATPPPAQTTPPAQTPSEPAQGDGQSEVSKAYGKLREAEEREKAAKKEADDLKKNVLPENETLKSRNAELEKENSGLKDDMTKWAAERLAQSKGFTDPEAAVAVLRSRGSDLSDESKAGKALDDYAKEKGVEPNATPPSGGPVNPQGTSTPGGNDGMNAMIRRGAGRA